MATIQAEILDSFYAKLSTSEAVDTATIDALRELFKSETSLRRTTLLQSLRRRHAGVRGDPDRGSPDTRIAGHP